MERVVLIGTGGFGQCWWPGLAEHGDDIEVAGVIEPDEQARADSQECFGLPADRVSPGIAGLLARCDATAVIDSSPFSFRQSNAFHALDAGLDLLVAKPLGASWAEAESIVADAERRGRSVCVAQQMRYFPCFTALRGLLARGELGAVRAVAVEMALDGRGWRPGMDWRLAMDHPLLIEAGIHHFDLLRWCLGTEIGQARALEWNPPWSPFRTGATASVQLLTVTGIPVVYNATFAPAPGRDPVRFDSGWQVVCDQAIVTVTDGGLYADGEQLLAPTPEPASLEALNAEVLRIWLDARATGRTPPFTGQDNLHSMRILDDVLRDAGKTRVAA